MGTDEGPIPRAGLYEVLERARTVGFLGPGPLRAQVEHAEGFLVAVPDDARRLVDLGSGGGVPALPIVVARPQVTAVLVEAMHKRAVFLGWAIQELGLVERVEVRRDRAEVLAHGASLRGWADVVTARGFAGPAVTAECAVGFLRVGGTLVVSEPPGEPARWPSAALDALGLSPAERCGSVARMVLQRPPAPEVPRPTRALVKRPLF